ncbi:MAG TPA: glycosyltransferase family 39 protein [Blastocatellia bacterium]|nr:glycosyltransferase family 39 protein [Blastocatellia bacterium]
MATTPPHSKPAFGVERMGNPDRPGLGRLLTSLDRVSLPWLFVGLFALTFILRICYSDRLFEDDGLWLTAGEQILRGKALYREVYFDKPPLLPLLYAALFRLFGPWLIVVRLFTMLYATGVALVLYLFALRLYGKREAVLAAGLFTIFSTTAGYGHVQGLNTDFLMVLPYSAAAFLFVLAADWRPAGSPRAALKLTALAGGAVAAVAFGVNPKALVDLLYFAVLLATRHLLCGGEKEDRAVAGSGNDWRAGAALFCISISGFLFVTGLVLAYLASSHSLTTYWQYVWVWGSRYARYYTARRVITEGTRVSFNYFVLNNTLTIALVFVAVLTFKRIRRRNGGQPPDMQPIGAGSSPGDQQPAPVDTRKAAKPDGFNSDVTLLIWLLLSFGGVSLGGRFFSHYFFQILPALCLIGGRGLLLIGREINSKQVTATGRRAIIALVLSGFLTTIIRFHTRTAALALDWARGRKSSYTMRWYHEVRNHQELMVSAIVRGLASPAEAERAVDSGRILGAEMRIPGASADYLFVWGYRPELYYYSGLTPASRYLSAQPLTGIPADVQYDYPPPTRLLLDSGTASRNRGQLIRDLTATQPEYIVDELGMFNSSAAITSFPELAEFMRGYREVGVVGLFRLFHKRGVSRKRTPSSLGPVRQN